MLDNHLEHYAKDPLNELLENLKNFGEAQFIEEEGAVIYQQVIPSDHYEI